ncbi:MAG: FAD-dependent monooxygenase [Planctomycetes bacterium]|nr:FAD-dependent monooxygenase [Planctomycetota bacterium]MBI3844419.1 FAD-dependent monooxygenase [Planctomycetota bacterium]
MTMGIDRVAVIGAGPAGAYAAHLLARAGREVTLVHRTRPLEKPCGGGVTRQALDDVPELPPIGGGRSIERTIFRAPSGREVSLEADSRERELLRIYPRRVLDAAVRRLAESSGARILEGSVASIERDGRGFRLRGEGIDAESSSWPFVIGADGIGSIVRRSLAEPLDERDTFLACGWRVEVDAAPTAILCFERRLRGYLWSFPREGEVSIGACALGSSAKPAALFERAARLADELVVDSAVPRKPYASRIPAPSSRTLRRLRVGGDGFALVGDASGLVDPLTGEGIRFAFRTARLAAESIVAGEGGPGYAERARRDVVPGLVSGARWRSVFYQPAFLEAMVALCAKRQGARRLLLDLLTGHQEYAGLLERLVGEGFQSLAACF